MHSETPKANQSRSSTRQNTGIKSRTSATSKESNRPSSSRASNRPPTSGSTAGTKAGQPKDFSKASSRQPSRVESRKEAEPDGISQLTVPKTPPGETADGMIQFYITPPPHLRAESSLQIVTRYSTTHNFAMGFIPL